ncbi:hypothetical protein ABN250_15330 [Providencia stuartii]|uniref:hypothetical protein n=1 Tax=Providencia stuartii TaxID=588 RepID=UPI0032DA2EF5
MSDKELVTDIAYDCSAIKKVETEDQKRIKVLEASVIRMEKQIEQLVKEVSSARTGWF